MNWRPRLGYAFRRTALPLLSYYAVTLALPLANGAAESGPAFVEHALVVLVVPPIVIALVCAVGLGSFRLAWRLSAESRQHLSRGMKRLYQFAQRERVDGSRHAEPLQPRSGCASRSAWRTPPPTDTRRADD